MNFKSALEVIGGVGDEGLGCVTQLLSETPASKRVSILLSFFPSLPSLFEETRAISNQIICPTKTLQKLPTAFNKTAISYHGLQSPVQSVSCLRLPLKYILLVYRTEKAMAPHSSTLAWKIPWTKETGRLQSMGSRRVRHDWVTSLSLFTFLHWRRKCQPTPVFLPGESQGRGSLVGCNLWGRTESDTTEAT